MAARARLSFISFKHACAACVFLCILLSGVATVLADVLDDDAARGRQLFLTGQARAPGLRAMIGAGDVTIPATAVPCASCHGRDGHGRKENGVAPPDITWSRLMRPSSRDASSGRSRAAYTEQSLVRAMTMGIDASGNRLDPVMPRFKLSLADAADLVAYLKRLGSLPEPGLHDRSLVVGVVLRPGESDIRRVLAA
jgi:mono/diheme cytochrome c family protein